MLLTKFSDSRGFKPRFWFGIPILDPFPDLDCGPNDNLDLKLRFILPIKYCVRSWLECGAKGTFRSHHSSIHEVCIFHSIPDQEVNTSKISTLK